MGKARNLLNYQSVSLSVDEIEPMLGNRILEEYGVEDSTWKDIVARDRGKMYGKLAKFKTRSLLPEIPKLADCRDNDFVEKQYSRTWSERPWPSARIVK